MSSRARSSKGAAPTIPLLVEIGCEEIPARFLTQAQKDLGEKLQATLESYRLLPTSCSGGVPMAARKESATAKWSLQTYSTPRRLVAFVSQVLAKQPDKLEDVMGPPVRVAFDASGKPTRAAESFAEKNGARLADLVRVTTPKGEYLAVKKTTRGHPALELLSQILPSVITGLSFPKSMYWTSKSGPRFVRPIRWILALLGEGKQARVVPFEIAGVRAGNQTYGHRSLGESALRVRGFNDYAKKLRRSRVEFDPAKRHKLVTEAVKEALELVDSNLIEDRDLEDWLVNSTEWPQPILGRFEERFLKLPREILATVMRDHQKYFGVEDRNGNLRPDFITVLNREGDSRGLIRAGHERVLTARFRDAEFFWQADLKQPFNKRCELLAGVTYREKLGSYADKVQRMRVLAQELSRQLQDQKKFRSVDADWAMRAVELSKCDLTTHMVQEFPELQGIVGGLYAKAWGEAREVHEAIYDQYMPQGLDGRCPRSPIGAVVSLADKIDTVTAGFAVGLEPAGSSDPFGLRRAGNGVVKILLELKLPIELGVIIDHALAAISVPCQKPDSELSNGVWMFLRERLRHYLEKVAGLRYDTVRAVFSAAWWHQKPLEMFECARDLGAIRLSPDFLGLSQAAKRIRNILEKSAKPQDYQGGSLNQARLDPGPELELYQKFAKVREDVERHKHAGQYRGALEAIATLRPAVDLFFDKVLVMAEDPGVRMNRLQLLFELHRLFTDIADLSEIESNTSALVDASTSKADRPVAFRRQPSTNGSARRSG